MRNQMSCGRMEEVQTEGAYLTVGGEVLQICWSFWRMSLLCQG